LKQIPYIVKVPHIKYVMKIEYNTNYMNGSDDGVVSFSNKIAFAEVDYKFRS
jgi:hypothetical protein